MFSDYDECLSIHVRLIFIRIEMEVSFERKTSQKLKVSHRKKRHESTLPFESQDKATLQKPPTNAGRNVVPHARERRNQTTPKNKLKSQTFLTIPSPSRGRCWPVAPRVAAIGSTDSGFLWHHLLLLLLHCHHPQPVLPRVDRDGTRDCAQHDLVSARVLALAPSPALALFREPRSIGTC